MSDGTALSRGDRNRNDRLARLRLLLPRENAIVGIDLANDKQAAVVADHDSRVIARRRVTCRAWELGSLLDWAVERAHAAGFTSVTVACEPTGHRWRVLDQLAADRGLPLVCVQPLLVWRAREAEDLTWDKSDPKDATLIARLAAERRCYEPERVDATWARLRHLGARRAALTTDATSSVQQLRDLLECVWPAVLDAAASPFRSKTWCAALAVVLQRCTGDPRRLRRLGEARFTAAVRRELPQWKGLRPNLRIVRAVFQALTDHHGVVAHRAGALERAGLVLADWQHTTRRLTDVEDRMVAVLDELGLTELVTSIDGLTAVGAAAILAETGDLARFRSPRALVKDAGVPSGQQQRPAPRQDRDLRPRTPRPAPGGLARGVGSDTEQRSARRPLHPPDDPRAQPPRSPTGSRRMRRRRPALAARRGHPTHRLERRHRRWRTAGPMAA